MTVLPASPPKTHATVDGVRYGIDHMGRVMAPDYDGNPDQLVLGTVARSGTVGPWDATPHDSTGRPCGAQELATRAEAIRFLEEIAGVRDQYPPGTLVRIDDREFQVCTYGIKDGWPTLISEGGLSWAYARAVERV